MKPLKLVALDEEDLAVVSAHVQDSTVKVSDLEFLAGERRFVLAMNRFAWETGRPKFRHKYQRRRSVLHFEGVTAVASVGIDRAKPEDVLVLLALNFVPGDLPGGQIELIFAGDASIRLTAEYVEARLADLGPAWETGKRPAHD